MTLQPHSPRALLDYYSNSQALLVAAAHVVSVFVTSPSKSRAVFLEQRCTPSPIPPLTSRLWKLCSADAVAEGPQIVTKLCQFLVPQNPMNTNGLCLISILVLRHFRHVLLEEHRRSFTGGVGSVGFISVGACNLSPISPKVGANFPSKPLSIHPADPGRCANPKDYVPCWGFCPRSH